MRSKSSSTASASSLPQLLDEGLMRQLAPVATIHAYKLEKEVTDGALLAGSPCPSKGAAGTSSTVGFQPPL
jgi:hypothetical protein